MTIHLSRMWSWIILVDLCVLTGGLLADAISMAFFSGQLQPWHLFSSATLAAVILLALLINIRRERHPAWN